MEEQTPISETWYIVKKALTGGIQEAQVGFGWYVYESRIGCSYLAHSKTFGGFVVGKEAFNNRSDAEFRAEQMRDAAIKSAERKIAKLRKMTFRSE